MDQVTVAYTNVKAVHRMRSNEFLEVRGRGAMWVFKRGTFVVLV